jgi:hypothetical protein
VIHVIEEIVMANDVVIAVGNIRDETVLRKTITVSSF